MRTRAPRAAVDTMIKAALPVLNGIAADSGDLLDHYAVREMDEPGVQYEQHMQKARAIRRMALEAGETLRKISRGLAAEEALDGKDIAT